MSAVVQVRRTVPVSREEAYRAWTDPDLVPQWFTPRGGSSAGAAMDVRVGGRYRWSMRLLGHEYHAVGEYLVVEPPRLLVFTFDWEGALVPAKGSVVTIEFTTRGEGTEIVVTHERLPGPVSRTLHRVGWIDLLRKLDRAPSAARRPPRRRRGWSARRAT